MADDARWRDAAILQVHTVENGFIVHDRSRDWQESNRWVFSSGADLGAWMGQWAEHHHPLPKSEGLDAEDGCADNSCGDKPGFKLVVQVGSLSFSFSSTTPPDEIIDGLRSLKSVSGNFVHYRLLDLDKGEVDAIFFTQFSGLLTYLLAEYSGLMSGFQATALMPL